MARNVQARPPSNRMGSQRWMKSARHLSGQVPTTNPSLRIHRVAGSMIQFYIFKPSHLTRRKHVKNLLQIHQPSAALARRNIALRHVHTRQRRRLRNKGGIRMPTSFSAFRRQPVSQRHPVKIETIVEHSCMVLIPDRSTLKIRIATSIQQLHELTMLCPCRMQFLEHEPFAIG